MDKKTEKSEKVTFNISKDKEFSSWFSEIIKRAELADLRYNVKGFVVFRPWSVTVMEKMYDFFEKELQAQGHLPCYFPAVIPEENFEKEAEHVEGFEPEVFWVTGAGENKIKRLALRPTSETAFYQLYSLWIRSWKDLPFRLYQRANVWRYETKATRPFIRSREFYWIEAHDCFSTREEAERQVKEDIEVTERIMHQKFGIPFLPLKRPEWDKFKGAVYTIGSDSIMPDGKVIQQPSTHLLGQNFSKAFDIRFRDKDGKEKFVWQTCYGPCISRIFASLIAIHGDDNGLVFPFCLAPIQVIIVPIFKKSNKEKIEKECINLRNIISEENISVDVDLSENTPGEKFYFWEMKGVPLRLEIGEKEINDKKFTLFIRDIRKKIKVEGKKLISEIKKQGEELDRRLKENADKNFKNSIVDAYSKKEIEEILNKKKIARCNFCSISDEGEKCAEIIEKELLASIRGVRADIDEKPFDKCVICGKDANFVVYIAKSY